MTAPSETGARAWLPLTPRGVAAFARASLRRLWLVQFIFAVPAAAAVVWFLDTAWCPVIRQAIRDLPARGEIRSGKLNWTGASPQSLADSSFLALSVDLNHSGQIRSAAHVQVEFGRDNVRIFSLLGYVECAYPKGWIIAFNQPDLQPWWGAWRPPLLWIAAGLTIVSVMASWALLATLYAVPLWMVGFFANRVLDFRTGWKLAGAALMPGALVMIAGIVLYGLGALDMVRFLAVTGAHFVLGWIYAFVGIFFIPKLTAGGAGKGNPFAAPAKGRAGQKK